jgi:hypothetical protein
VRGDVIHHVRRRDDAAPQAELALLPQPQAGQPLPACRLVEVIPFDRPRAVAMRASMPPAASAR